MMLDSKELAKKMISPYVLRGDTIDSLMRGQMGKYCAEYNLSIGGYVYHDDKFIYKAKRDEIVVSRINGKDCCYIFNLKKLYNEINSGQLKLV